MLALPQSLIWLQDKNQAGKKMDCLGVFLGLIIISASA